MKLFQCQSCGQVLHFENTACLRCGRTVGYLPEADRMVALEPAGADWQVAGEAAQGRFCRNWELSACNWLLPAGEPGEYCAACRHNRLIPDLSAPENHARWQKIEAAKRRLLYSLRHLGLPLPEPGSGAAEPLVFDFLADQPGGGPAVMTGHAGGVVTLALTEADDAQRESRRTRLGEPYRTLLGHFRHEIGHFYWDVLVRDGGQVDAFRALFGDESADYGAALDRHYREGAPAGWQDSHVSAYATMHPWEDWAETWAHYLHMTDTLETAAALGMVVDPERSGQGELLALPLQGPVPEAPMEALLAAWLPLTVALNTLNRAMGQQDLYPFTLAVPVQAKLGFIHDLIRERRGLGAEPPAGIFGAR